MKLTTIRTPLKMFNFIIEITVKNLSEIFYEIIFFVSSNITCGMFIFWRTFIDNLLMCACRGKGKELYIKGKNFIKNKIILQPQDFL